MIKLCLVLALLSLPSWAAAVAEKHNSNGFQYQIDSRPAWVSNGNENFDKVPVTRDTGSVQELLFDNQVNLLGGSSVNYIHQIRRPIETSGMEEVSQIRISFNPSYETLTLHDVSIIRDGKRLARLKSAKIDLLRREEKLEQKMIDGQVTAVIVLPDVRLGDTIEAAYSLAGDNPVFGNKYSGFFLLGYDRPISTLNLRLIYPASKNLHYDVLKSTAQPIISDQGNNKVLTLKLNNTPAIRNEEATPKWFKVYPEIDISEFANWKEVNQWAANHFNVKSEHSAVLTKVIEQIKNDAKTDEEKIIKAMHFVQEEIRYFGVEIGASSHKPNPPHLTLEQRYGDCKDKTTLLTAILDGLGFQAQPALVSFARGKGIEKRIATPLMFDHVITHLKFNNKEYWLDGTISLQGDKLDTLGFEPYGYTLLVNGNDDHLSAIQPPENFKNDVRYLHHFEIGDYKSPIKLMTTRIFSGNSAEVMRRYVAAQGLDKIAKDARAQLNRYYQNLESSEPSTIVDNRADNQLTITQNYTLKDFFSYENGSLKKQLAPVEMAANLSLPRETNRTMPLDLLYPASVSQRIELHLPESSTTQQPQNINVSDQHFVFSAKADYQPQQLNVEFRFRHLKEAVEVPQLAGYIEKFRQANKYLGYSPSIPLLNKDVQNELSQKAISSLGRSFNIKEPDTLSIMQARFNFTQLMTDHLIQTQKLDGKLLAAVYEDQGIAFNSMNRPQDGLQSLNQSITLDGSREGNFINRAIIKHSLGQFDSAMQDLDDARKLHNSETSTDLRGITKYYLGNYDDARKDLLKSVEESSGEDQLHRLFWLHFTNRRLGNNGLNDLEKFGNSSNTDQWPAQAVAFFENRMSADELLAVATKDKKMARLNSCEAYFYIGQNALLNHDHAAAKTAFNKVIETGATMYREYTFAKEELRRLADSK